MPFAEPAVPASTTDERELLLRFAEWQRQQVVATAAGLDEDQLRWTPDGALVPIIGAVNHLRCMEQRWLEGRFLGTSFPARTDEWHPAAPGAEVIEAYAAQARRTEAIARAAASLDEPCLGREGDGPTLHELLGSDEPVTLRYALLHVIEETAHHAGHVDATRELLDGRRMRA